MKIRTDFVTNSSSSSFCISLGIKTKDDPYWYIFYDGLWLYYETKCSPKQLAECDTVTDLFRKFHDESSIEGKVLAWENFFKFYDDGEGEVEGFLDEHGEKRVSEYITDIGIFSHEEALYDEDDYQDTEYTYNLETGEYVKKISGEIDVTSDGGESCGIVVPDEEEVTVFITEYNGQERDVWKASEQKEEAPAVSDNSCTEISSEFLDVIPPGLLEDDFDDPSLPF